MPDSTRKSLLFLIHGARADQPALRHLVGWVREKGHIVDARVTWEAGDAERFAAEGAARGVDAVVAIGGDGTANEVLNGLSGSTVPLGIIPVGTANDFARQVGIPDDVDHAMDVILQQPPTIIDSAELNGRRFLNVSTGGVGAEATAETPADAKETLGTLAYAITGVRKLADLRPQSGHFAGLDFDLHTKFLLFAVGNAGMTGGGTRVAPRASVTDGLLDVCIVESLPRADFARLLLKVRRGEHIGEPGVHYVQLPSLTITTRRPVSVNVDGEPLSLRTLSYHARPHDLAVFLPHLPEAGVSP
ncbi:MAG: YegS/Rv2252/BmrU family lipid kinase [Gemmatimonadaceae bacterium]